MRKLSEQDEWKEAAEFYRAENERLRGHLSAAGINLTAAGIIARKLGSDADADFIGKMADQVIKALEQ